MENGITRVVLPEFDYMLATEKTDGDFRYNIGEHTLHVIEQIGHDGKQREKKELQILRYAALLHETAKPKEIMQRLKFDNETTEYVVRLAAAHGEYPDLCEEYSKNLTAMRRLMHRLGPDLLELLWELQRADALALSPDALQEKLSLLSESKKLYAEVLERGDCISLKQLAVNGKDLVAMGMQPGKQIGESLEKFLQEVLENPEKNTKEYLLGLL